MIGRREKNMRSDVRRDMNIPDMLTNVGVPVECGRVVDVKRGVLCRRRGRSSSSIVVSWGDGIKNLFEY